MPSYVDRRLEAICLKALSPSPAERYPDLDAMANDLDRWLSGKKTRAKPRRLPVAQVVTRNAAFLAAAAVALWLAVLLLAHRRSTALTIARLNQDRLRMVDALDERAGELDRKNREFAAKLAEQATQFEGERATFRQPLARLHLQRAESFEAAGDLLQACVHLASAIDQGAQSWNETEKQRVRDELAVLAASLIPALHPRMWPRFGGPMPRVEVPELNEWLGIERDHPTRRWPARPYDTHLAADRRDLAQAVSPGDKFAFLFPAAIWRCEDGSSVETAVEPSGCSAAAFRADGHTLLIAYGNRMVRFWDATTGKPSGDPVRHPQIVRSAAFAHDGRSALAAGQDRVIRRIDPATGQVGGELLRHPVSVKRLRYEPDSKEFTSLGHDGIERRWDVATGASRGIPVAHVQSVTKLALSPDRRSLLKVIRGSLPEQQFGQLWDREGHPLGQPFPMFSPAEATREISLDGEAILAGACRGPLVARLAISPAMVARMRGGDSLLRLSQDGKVALTVGLEGGLRIWDVASLQPRGPEFRASTSILALSRDGQVAATRGPGDAVRLWSTTRGKLLATLDTGGGRVSQLSFSPDGALALSWSEPSARFSAPPVRYEVNRWDVATGRSIGPPLSVGSRIRSAEFSPDGSTILTLGDQDDVRLWKTATGQLIGSWPLEPTGSVLAAAFHPDGKTLATGGLDGALQRWSTDTGLAAGPPIMVGSAIRIIAYAAKGRTLMTICTDSTSLWDAQTGHRLAPPLPAGGRSLFAPYTPHGAALSPDGMRVLTKEPYTGRTRLWDAMSGHPLGPACMVEGEPCAVER